MLLCAVVVDMFLLLLLSILYLLLLSLSQNSKTNVLKQVKQLASTLFLTVFHVCMTAHPLFEMKHPPENNPGS